MKWESQRKELRTMFFGLAKVAIFTTNGDSENQFLIKERGWNKGTILGCRFCLCQDARRAFSGTKKSTNNPEDSGTK